MKLTRKVATRAAVLVATGGVVLGMATTAFATPPYEPDGTNQLGQVLFYDSSGNLVTSGNLNDDPNFAYAVATSDDPISANTTATLFAYTPQLPGSLPTTWPGSQLTASTSFPVASPARIAALGAHRPVVTMDTTANGVVNFAGYIADKPNTNTTASGWANFYQLRIKTPGNTKWWAADILVNPSTGTWTMDYPSLGATATTLATSPGTSQTETTAGAGAPNAVTLTATVTANQPGTVKFMDTDPNPDVQVGTTQTLPASSTNTASVTIPAGLAVGVHHYEAIYQPPVGTLVGPSNGTATYTVNAAAADSTNTALSASPLTGPVGTSFTLTANVSDTTPGHTATVPQGTVQFRDNGVAIAGASGHTDPTGQVQVSGAFGFATGGHPITAQFTPDTGLFNASTSSAITVTVTPGAGDPCGNTGTPLPYPSDTRTDICHDGQTFEVTVPRGNLFISTPYHPGHVFNLGTMRLSSDGTTLHASAPFGTASGVSPSADGVTIIDTRSSGEGWSASVTSSDFTLVGTPGPTGDSTINACNLGFTGITPDYITGNAINGSTKPITVPAAGIPNAGAPGVAAGNTSCTSGLKGAPHQFASIASNGTGSVNVVGDMDLYAPTSTQAGLYRATVTFSIVSLP